MKKKIGCLPVVLFISLISFGLFKFQYPTYDWHQKLTVTVDTPDGEIAGSSVVFVEWDTIIKILPDAKGISGTVRGEAAVVDLGESETRPRYMFALIRNAKAIALDTFSPEVGPWHPRVSKVEDSEGVVLPVPRKFYPLLVTFNDINKPVGVKAVNPNDLAATFGEGYSLKSITLEITDEPVTEGEVKKVLRWLDWSREKFLNYSNGTNPLMMADSSPRGYRFLRRTSFLKEK